MNAWRVCETKYSRRVQKGKIIVIAAAEPNAFGTENATLSPGLFSFWRTENPSALFPGSVPGFCVARLDRFRENWPGANGGNRIRCLPGGRRPACREDSGSNEPFHSSVDSPGPLVENAPGRRSLLGRRRLISGPVNWSNRFYLRVSRRDEREAYSGSSCPSTFSIWYD